MAGKEQEPMEDQPASEPKQKTFKGREIPVPKRDQVMADFKKIAKPKKG